MNQGDQFPFNGRHNSLPNGKLHFDRMESVASSPASLRFDNHSSIMRLVSFETRKMKRKQRWKKTFVYWLPLAFTTAIIITLTNLYIFELKKRHHENIVSLK